MVIRSVKAYLVSPSQWLLFQIYRKYLVIGLSTKRIKNLIDAFDLQNVYLTAFNIDTPYANYEQRLLLFNLFMKFTLSNMAIDVTSLFFFSLYFLI